MRLARLALCLTMSAPLFGADNAAMAKDIDVAIEHFAFVPAVIEVEPGDKITFTNHDFVPHTATATNKTWTTKDLGRDQSEVVVVPDKGFGAYFCRYHPSMKGQLNRPKP